MNDFRGRGGLSDEGVTPPRGLLTADDDLIIEYLSISISFVFSFPNCNFKSSFSLLKVVSSSEIGSLSVGYKCSTDLCACESTPDQKCSQKIVSVVASFQLSNIFVNDGITY